MFRERGREYLFLGFLHSLMTTNTSERDSAVTFYQYLAESHMPGFLFFQTSPHPSKVALTADTVANTHHNIHK
jgi:hypothetical protein